MTRLKSEMCACLSAFAIAALPVMSQVNAQPTEQRAPGMMGMMPMIGMGPGGMMSMMMSMGDHVEGRIAFLKTELKITDAQTPQWNAFADALRANAQRIREMRTTMMQGGMIGQGDASPSAPDRLDRMEMMMTNMLEVIKTTKSALGPLYGTLSDEQKKVADQLIHGPMGMGHM
jgi:hypothetical protein